MSVEGGGGGRWRSNRSCCFMLTQLLSSSGVGCLWLEFGFTFTHLDGENSEVSGLL